MASATRPVPHRSPCHPRVSRPDRVQQLFDLYRFLFDQGLIGQGKQQYLMIGPVANMQLVQRFLV